MVYSEIKKSKKAETNHTNSQHMLLHAAPARRALEQETVGSIKQWGVRAAGVQDAPQSLRPSPISAAVLQWSAAWVAA